MPKQASEQTPPAPTPSATGSPGAARLAMMQTAPAAGSNGATADDWTKTEAGIERKAAEYHVDPIAGETYGQLRARVLTAMSRAKQA